MSDDLISRQAAIDDAHSQIWYRLNPNMKERMDKWLSELPSVQPEQKIGHWIICSFYVLFSDGDASIQYEDFKDRWHKIGHIGKFAEALKELEKMAKSGGD